MSDAVDWIPWDKDHPKRGPWIATVDLGPVEVVLEREIWGDTYQWIHVIAGKGENLDCPVTLFRADGTAQYMMLPGELVMYSPRGEPGERHYPVKPEFVWTDGMYATQRADEPGTAT